MSGEVKMVNVSVANLFVSIRLNDNVPTPIAVINPTDENMPLQALNAGPKFTFAAENYMRKAFKADPSGFSNDSDGTRCRIPEDKLNDFQSWLEKVVSASSKMMTESDCHPKLKECLTGQYWEDTPPPLSEEDYSKIKLTVCSQPALVRQPPLDEEVHSGGEPEVRFFVKMAIAIESDELFNKLVDCPAIIFLGLDALKSTNGGRCQGKFGDYVLADNIGVKHYQP